MKFKAEDIKRIKSKIRRDEFSKLKSYIKFQSIIFNNRKQYTRKTKHKNNENNFRVQGFYLHQQKKEKMKKLVLKMTDLFKGGCPRCGEYCDGDVCQTRGYPWS